LQFSIRQFHGTLARVPTCGYFSADRRVVFARVFFGPAFLVAVVRRPCARDAACFG
jgi:hypothetical protein